MILRTLALVLAMFACPALAGELRIDIKAEGTADMADTTVLARSTDLEIASVEPGVFSFSFKDSADIMGPVTITTDDVPAAMAAFEMRFNVPFYWDTAEATRLAAAVVPSDLALDTAGGIIRDGQSLPQSASGLIVLNQRARIAFGKLRAEFNIRQPSSSDAMVAFVFAQTSKELGYRYFLEPDDEMLDVVSWLAAAAEGPDAQRLFPRPAELANAKEVVRQFGLISAMQRASLVDAVSKFVAQPDRKARGCAHAEALDTFYLDLFAEEQPPESANRRREIQNLTNVAICKYDELKKAGTLPPDSPLLDEARAIQERMAGLIAAYAPPDEHGGRVVEIAQKRSDDLATLIPGRPAPDA